MAIQTKVQGGKKEGKENKEERERETEILREDGHERGILLTTNKPKEVPQKLKIFELKA